MRLDRHIATRFLTDDILVMEMMEDSFPGIPMEEYTEHPKALGLFQVLSKENQKAFYVTQTVINTLEMLKVSRKDGKYDWSVFNQVNDGKFTYIFPDNSLLRVFIDKGVIHCTHLAMEMLDKDYGTMKWVMFYVDKITGEKCAHFGHEDVQRIEEFVYRLLCFVHLTENDEIVLQPKAKMGTKKSGKIMNTLPIALTIINSRWNTTVIRGEGFNVRGHFAIRWTGVGRTFAKIVFIEPFEKNGYTIKAKSEEAK